MARLRGSTHLSIVEQHDRRQRMMHRVIDDQCRRAGRQRRRRYRRQSPRRHQPVEKLNTASAPSTRLLCQRRLTWNRQFLPDRRRPAFSFRESSRTGRVRRTFDLMRRDSTSLIFRIVALVQTSHRLLRHFPNRRVRSCMRRSLLTFRWMREVPLSPISASPTSPRCRIADYGVCQSPFR